MAICVNIYTLRLLVKVINDKIARIRIFVQYYFIREVDALPVAVFNAENASAPVLKWLRGISIHGRNLYQRVLRTGVRFKHFKQAGVIFSNAVRNECFILIPLKLQPGLAAKSQGRTASVSVIKIRNRDNPATEERGFFSKTDLYSSLCT